MMKPFIISLIALCCFIDVQAQKVTRNYDNVTMSEALRDLNELSPDYTISFMYNELEGTSLSQMLSCRSLASIPSGPSSVESMSYMWNVPTRPTAI